MEPTAVELALEKELEAVQESTCVQVCVSVVEPGEALVVEVTVVVTVVVCGPANRPHRPQEVVVTGQPEKVESVEKEPVLPVSIAPKLSCETPAGAWIVW